MFIDRCERAMRVSFYCLIFFLPISTALTEIFASLSLIFFFTKKGGTFYYYLKELSVQKISVSFWKKTLTFLKFFKPVKSYLSWPIGMFIFVGFLSVWVSDYPLLSIKAFFFKLLQGTYLYFNFIECIKTKRHLAIFLSIFIASSALIGINGIFQNFTGHGFIHGRSSLEHFSQGRITSAFKHSNDFGAYLVVVCSLLLGLGLFNRWRWDISVWLNALKIQHQKRFDMRVKIFIIILFILSMTCLGLTFSRGAWAGFFIAAIFLGLHKKRIFFSAAIVILFVLIFQPLMTKIRNVSFVSDDIRKGKISKEQEVLCEGHIQEEFSLSRVYWEKFKKITEHLHGKGRKTYWEEATVIIRRSPLLGVGLNTYTKVAPKYVQYGSYPHNCYLHLAAEMGFIGLSFFIGIMVVLFLKSIQSLRNINEKFSSAVLLGSLAGLLGFLAQSFVDTNFYSVQLGNLMWIVMGVIVAVQRIDKNVTAP